MKETDYFKIHGWMMRAPYNLQGRTLILFAALYALTRKGEQVYTAQWLCDWLDMPRTTLNKAISELKKLGVLSACEVGWRTYALQAFGPDKNGQNSDKNGQTSDKNGQTTPYLCGTESTAIKKERKNKDKNNFIFLEQSSQNKIEVGQADKQQPQKSIFLDKDFLSKTDARRFAPPTLEQVTAYAAEHHISQDTALRFFHYYEGNGWELRRGKRCAKWQSVLQYWDIKQAEYLQKHPAANAQSANSGPANTRSQTAKPTGERFYTEMERNAARRQANDEAYEREQQDPNWDATDEWVANRIREILRNQR